MVSPSRLIAGAAERMPRGLEQEAPRGSALAAAPTTDLCDLNMFVSFFKPVLYLLSFLYLF